SILGSAIRGCSARAAGLPASVASRPRRASLQGVRTSRKLTRAPRDAQRPHDCRISFAYLFFLPAAFFFFATERALLSTVVSQGAGTCPSDSAYSTLFTFFLLGNAGNSKKIEIIKGARWKGRNSAEFTGLGP